MVCSDQTKWKVVLYCYSVDGQLSHPKRVTPPRRRSLACRHGLWNHQRWRFYCSDLAAILSPSELCVYSSSAPALQLKWTDFISCCGYWSDWDRKEEYSAHQKCCPTVKVQGRSTRTICPGTRFSSRGWSRDGWAEVIWGDCLMFCLLAAASCLCMSREAEILFYFWLHRRSINKLLVSYLLISSKSLYLLFVGRTHFWLHLNTIFDIFRRRNDRNEL